jgi:hypothetical protein
MAVFPWGCVLRGFPAAAHIQYTSRCGLARRKKFAFRHRTRSRVVNDSWIDTDSGICRSLTETEETYPTACVALRAQRMVGNPILFHGHLLWALSFELSSR